MMVKPKPENIEIGKRIKSARISQGKDLASFGASITPPASASIASRWERGINLPNSERLQSIAEQSGVSVDYLLHGPNLDRARTAVGVLNEVSSKLEANGSLPNSNHKMKNIADFTTLFISSSDSASLDLLSNMLLFGLKINEKDDPLLTSLSTELMLVLTHCLVAESQAEKTKSLKELQSGFNSLVNLLKSY